MKIITGKLGSGKTFEMIRHACRNDLTVVFKYKEFADEARRLAFLNFHHDLKTISYNDFLNNVKTSQEKYIIDDIESFLSMLNKDISGFVYNGDDVTFTERVNDKYYKQELIFY